jgi:uncharacterized membrane protein YfcA
MTASDIIFNAQNITKLLFLGFFGGFLAGAFGLGGGVIFNPILLTMGLPPQVAGKASLFLVCFSKIASTVVYILNDALNLDYGLWVGLWSSVGGFAGAFTLIAYIKYTSRQSTLVWILVFEFVLAIAINDAYGFI